MDLNDANQDDGQDDDDRNPLLDQVLAEYLLSLESGSPISILDIIARYPQLADELEAFFDDDQAIDSFLTKAARRELGATDAIRPRAAAGCKSSGEQPSQAVAPASSSVHRPRWRLATVGALLLIAAILLILLAILRA